MGSPAHSAGTQMIFGDERWAGTHGIGRYATEVLGRLSDIVEPLRLTGRPGSPLDLLRPRILRRNSLIYSPGYNASPSNCQQLVTVHDLIHLQSAGPQHRAYYETVLKRAIRRAGRVITVSKTSQRKIVEWLDSDRIEVVDCGNGLSETFRASTQAAPSERGDHLLYVGNLKPHKNFHVLMEALRIDKTLELIAVTPTPSLVSSIARSAEVGGRVRALSGLDDREMAALYRSARATVLPSEIEGFGLPALESIGMGSPVIYWKGCESIAEIVDGNGWEVQDLRSPEAWAWTMSEARERNMEFNPIEATHSYSWESVAQAVRQQLVK
ncbi:glycosyltransferase family 4 protein [Microbacterium sp. NPDC091382]|uniref:glycosyltransferase family 4 protein n=1 Tax=Microbacterium sp. NPDC091382 TaxID=3364210 RepID=UPI0037F24F01